MSKKASEEVMEELHATLAEVLANAIGAMPKDEPNASLINVARQFLKDNGIDGVAVTGSALERVKDSLPSFDEDDDDYESVVPFHAKAE
jgi:hypothetical protein